MRSSLPGTNKDQAHSKGIPSCEGPNLEPGIEGMGCGKPTAEKNIHNRPHKILQCLGCYLRKLPRAYETHLP